MEPRAAVPTPPVVRRRADSPPPRALRRPGPGPTEGALSRTLVMLFRWNEPQSLTHWLFD